MCSLFLILLALSAHYHLHFARPLSVDNGNLLPGSHHSLLQDPVSHEASSIFSEISNIHNHVLARRAMPRSTLQVIEEGEEESDGESIAGRVDTGTFALGGPTQFIDQKSEVTNPVSGEYLPSGSSDAETRGKNPSLQNGVVTNQAGQPVHEEKYTYSSLKNKIIKEYPDLVEIWKESIGKEDQVKRAMDEIKNLKPTGFFHMASWRDEQLDVARMLAILNLKINGLKLRHIDKPIEQLSLSEQGKIVKLFSGLAQCDEYAKLTNFDETIQEDLIKYKEISKMGSSRRAMIWTKTKLKKPFEDVAAAFFIFRMIRK
ncbi:hypothetical protein PtB15_1B74 [Puccinia triticina]|nr:hypothetical protein PtB15_1B74 [Puccinia triticina]